jgi:hypothetical protein
VSQPPTVLFSYDFVASVPLWNTMAGSTMKSVRDATESS